MSNPVTEFDPNGGLAAALKECGYCYGTGMDAEREPDGTVIGGSCDGCKASGKDEQATREYEAARLRFAKLAEQNAPEELRKMARRMEAAARIIEDADRRCLAWDGAVGHVRDEMTDAEWRKLYLLVSGTEERANV